MNSKVKDSGAEEFLGAAVFLCVEGCMGKVYYRQPAAFKITASLKIYAAYV